MINLQLSKVQLLPDDVLQKVGLFLDSQSVALANPTCRTFNQMLPAGLLTQFATTPFFKEAFKARIGKAESDGEKCRRIIETVTRSLELGRSLLTNEEFPGVFETRIEDLSYKQREQMGNTIAEKRASILISFFEKIANQVPIAQTFLNSLEALPNREKAKEIRQWMRENRQDLTLQLVTAGRQRRIPLVRQQIPKEILLLDLPQENISDFCIIWSGLNHCEPLLEILKNPVFLPLRQDHELIYLCLVGAFTNINLEIIKILSRFEGFRNIPQDRIAALWASTFQ